MPRLALTLLLLLLAPSLALADPPVLVAGSPILLAVPLHFDARDGSLDPADDTILHGVANMLLQRPTMTIAISVHTGAFRAAAFNLHISQIAADHVRDCLVSHGVDASRLTAVGYGESQPLPDGTFTPRILLSVVHP